MQKTKYERFLKILPINIGDKVYYCFKDHEDAYDEETPHIPYLCELLVIGVLQAPKVNKDCDPIFILYDSISNRAHVRMAVWQRTLILQTKDLMNKPKLCASIVRQYVSFCEVAYHV